MKYSKLKFIEVDGKKNTEEASGLLKNGFHYKIEKVKKKGQKTWKIDIGDVKDLYYDHTEVTDKTDVENYLFEMSEVETETILEESY